MPRAKIIRPSFIDPDSPGLIFRFGEVFISKSSPLLGREIKLSELPPELSAQLLRQNPELLNDGKLNIMEVENP